MAFVWLEDSGTGVAGATLSQRWVERGKEGAKASERASERERGGGEKGKGTGREVFDAWGGRRVAHSDGARGAQVAPQSLGAAEAGACPRLPPAQGCLWRLFRMRKRCRLRRLILAAGRDDVCRCEWAGAVTWWGLKISYFRVCGFRSRTRAFPHLRP